VRCYCIRLWRHHAMPKHSVFDSLYEVWEKGQRTSDQVSRQALTQLRYIALRSILPVVPNFQVHPRVVKPCNKTCNKSNPSIVTHCTGTCLLRNPHPLPYRPSHAVAGMFAHYGIMHTPSCGCCGWLMIDHTGIIAPALLLQHATRAALLINCR